MKTYGNLALDDSSGVKQTNQPERQYQQRLTVKDLPQIEIYRTKLADRLRRSRRKMVIYEELDLSNTTVQNFLNPHYRYIPLKLTFDKIKGYIDHLEALETQKRAQVKRPAQSGALVETAALGTIRSSLEICFAEPERGICAVVGPSGCGKTTALKAILGGYSRFLFQTEQGKKPYILLTAVEGLGAKSLLMYLCEELGIPQKKGTLPYLIRLLGQFLKENQVAVVLDEADWIFDRKTLNALRSIWQIAPFSLFLCGLPEKLRKLQEAREKNEQLLARFHFCIEVPSLSIAEAELFFNRAGLRLKNSLIERAYLRANRNAHFLLRSIEVMKRVEGRGEQIIEEAVDQIFAGLLFTIRV